jgi:transcriptional regulator of acetoin/glycerol metabolism
MSAPCAQEPQFKLNVERVIRAGSSPAPEGAQSRRSGPPGAEAQALDLKTAILNHVRHVLGLNQGNKLRTARQLGISRSTLYRILGGD